MDISFYVSMYIQDEYRRLYAYFLVLLFTVNVISYLLLRVVLLTLSRADDAYGRQPQIVKVYKLSQFVTLFLVPQASFCYQNVRN